MKIVFAGTPEFAASALAALLEAGHEIALVLTQPDRPAGRGLEAQPSAVKLLAQAQGTCRRCSRRRSDASVAAAVQLRADAEVMVVAAYGLILPRRAARSCRARGCLNIHASLLPRWRGAAPIQRALLAATARPASPSCRWTRGSTPGPMLLQEALPIAADETAGTLHDKLAALGARLIVRALAARARAAAAGRRRARPMRAKIDKERGADRLARPGAGHRAQGARVRSRARRRRRSSTAPR